MRILFLCGSIEPGKDGVGDYCRSLATELLKTGNPTTIVSMYDSYVKKSIRTVESSGGYRIPSLRISSAESSEKRLTGIQDVVDNFYPDWISLQYVPNSFHPKGLNTKFPFLLAQIKGKHKWQMMIHEPWLISDQKVSSIRLCISWLQEKLLKLLIKKIKPRLIHTSNLYYKEILDRGGVYCSILSLPSNIPVNPKINSGILSELGISQRNREDWLVLGTFGRIRENIDYLEFFQSFLKTSEARGKNIALLSIGKAGKYCDTVFIDLKKNFQNVFFYKLGESSPEDISSLLQVLDYGITSLPDYLLGKSGGYSAMRNHGLKILVPKFKSIIKKKSNSNYSNYLFNLPDKEFSPTEVAQKFRGSLS